MKRVKPTTLVFTTAAVVVVAISVLLTLRRGDAAMRPDPAPFSGSTVVRRLPSLLPAARLPDRVTVVVVRDDAAASFYGTGGNLDRIVTEWRNALAAAGADVRVLSPAAAAADRSARVVVVPSSPCLTAATRQAMDEVTARGGGVIITGLAGYFDAACRPIGYGLVVASTGASRADTLEQRPMVYVTLPGRSVLTVDVPPGSRLDLNPAGQVAVRHPTRDAFYSDYALRPQPAGDTPLLDGAMTHRRVGQGRLVYWGFELTDAAPGPWNRALLRLLVRNAVLWSAGLPVVSVEPWRSGRGAAAAFAQDVESQFTNARFALDSLRAAGVRGTYFLTSNIAARHERLSRDMANAGEVGTHTENHRLLGGSPAVAQRQRLAVTQRELSRMFGLPVDGLRPPQEQFDEATLAGWVAAGGRYLFGANDSRSASPEMLSTGRDTVVLIGRIASDDIAATAAGHDEAPAVARLFLDEFQQMRALGGLYVLSYHSQLLARPDLVPALATLARAVAADSTVWLTTTGEIAEWWRERAQLTARLRAKDHGFDVVVQNRGERLVRGAVIRIELPDLAPRRIASASTALLPAPAGTVRLLLPPVPGMTTRTFTVDYPRPTAPAARRSSGARPAVKHRSWLRFLPWRR